MKLVWKNHKQKITRREFQIIKNCLRARFETFRLMHAENDHQDVNKLLLKIIDLENRVWDGVQKEISDMRKSMTKEPLLEDTQPNDTAYWQEFESDIEEKRKKETDEPPTCKICDKVTFNVSGMCNACES